MSSEFAERPTRKKKYDGFNPGSFLKGICTTSPTVDAYRDTQKTIHSSVVGWNTDKARGYTLGQFGTFIDLDMRGKPARTVTGKIVRIASAITRVILTVQTDKGEVTVIAK